MGRPSLALRACQFEGFLTAIFLLRFLEHGNPPIVEPFAPAAEHGIIFRGRLGSPRGDLASFLAAAFAAGAAAHLRRNRQAAVACGNASRSGHHLVALGTAEELLE